MTSSERTTFRPLQRYEQIAERLADDIRSGVLAPGERLPSERDLARTLEVSRASVREALASLALQGVVETRHGAGTFVVGLPPSEPPHDASPSAVLEARLALEPAVARLAAARGQARRDGREAAGGDGGRAGGHRHLERLRPALSPPARGR